MWFSTQAAAVVTSFMGNPVNRTVPYGAGVLALKRYPGMDVYLGRGVGGGSLVNIAMLITPLREVLAEVMPTGFLVDDFLLRHYPKAKAKLKANTIRPAYFESSPYHQYARTLRANVAKAGYTTELLPSGYDFAYMEKEEAGTVPRSALGGEGGFGNNHGKNSLDKTYIAEAVGTGRVTIRAMTSVKKIERLLDKTYVVTAEEIDLAGNVLRRYQIGCDHLFLAGGSIGSTEMLMRARQTGMLPRLNAYVGTRWSANGDIFVCRQNTPENPVGLQQAIVPASGFRTRDQNNKPLFSMHLPLPFPFESGISMSIVMPRNPETGTFSYNASTDQATLNWSQQNAPAVASAKHVFDKVNAANGTQYRTDLFSGKVMSDAATYHPVGGVPLGRATDLYGRVSGYDKLYVIDGSLIPGALAANPALTVAALAERNIENILLRDF
jgi:cholesterol oxidase